MNKPLPSKNVIKNEYAPFSWKEFFQDIGLMPKMKSPVPSKPDISVTFAKETIPSVKGKTTIKPTATPTATPTITQLLDAWKKISSNQYENKIREGYSKWSSVPQNELNYKLPATKDIPLMAKLAKEYNVPYWLIPVFTILETSAGQNMAQENNPTNWGIRTGWQPGSSEDVYRKMLWSFTNRPDEGLNYSERYQQPLKEGNYQKFFEGYEPPSENADYWKNAQEIMKFFM